MRDGALLSHSRVSSCNQGMSHMTSRSMAQRCRAGVKAVSRCTGLPQGSNNTRSRAQEARAAAARAAFRIAGRKRDEGVISQVEFLDARTSLTAAELNLNAVRFELLARQADLDYATGAPRS